MNYKHIIFCKSEMPVSKNEVIHFIEEGNYFGEDQHFIERDLNQDQWELDVIYEKGKKPVVIKRYTDNAYFDKDLKELDFILGISKKSKPQQRIADALKETKQVYFLEMDREVITDDVWEMIDNLQAMLMEKCEGLLMTGDNEFYDKNLKKIYKL